jgi:20S proteasome subunit beta 4
MDINVGIKGNDFVMLLADTSSNRSIFTLKHNEDKITKLDDMKLLACSGEQSSRVEFSEFVQKNLALYRLRNDHSLSNSAAANYIRHQVAEALRTRSPFQANSVSPSCIS